MSKDHSQPDLYQPYGSIRALTASEEDTAKLHSLWTAIFPSWPISPDFFKNWLFALPGNNHFIHESGFCLSFIGPGEHSYVAAVGVLPGEQRRGLGTALLKRAKEGYLNVARDAGTVLDPMKMGSQTPRFWPRVPKDIASEAEGWFTKAGIRAIEGPTMRDLYKDIRSSIAPPDIMAKAASSDYRFEPWSPELYEETMVKQTELFPWAAAYEFLHQHNLHDQVLIAFDPDTNQQVGWTLMCAPDSLASQPFAFRTLTPTGDKTGLIAAVGTDNSVRGKGVGLALMVKAMESMRSRGAEGVFVDSTVLTGFYERLGFETLFEYDEYVYDC